MTAPAPLDVQRRWNRVITTTLVRHAVLLQLLPGTATGYAALPTDCLKRVQPLIEELHLAACAHRESDPRSLRALERIINRRLWNELVPFSKRRVGAFQQLDFDPYRNAATTREWCARLDADLAQSAATLVASRPRTLTG
jgi:hypothetical protein